MRSINDLFPQGGDSELVGDVSKKSDVSKDEPGVLGTTISSCSWSSSWTGLNRNLLLQRLLLDDLLSLEDMIVNEKMY